MSITSGISMRPFHVGARRSSQRAGGWLFALALWLALAVPAAASEEPFTPGWVLDPAGSELTLEAVREDASIASLAFTRLSGEIDAAGRATIRIGLDEIETGRDLNDVRLRFGVFETFLHPEAVITATLDGALADTLARGGRAEITLSFALDLAGVRERFEAPVIAERIAETVVQVRSRAPVAVAAAAFGLDANIDKLEETTGARIARSGAVAFSVSFRRGTGAGAQPRADQLSEAACAERLEELSSARQIGFAAGSAALDPASRGFLIEVADTVRRCQGIAIEVEGHTDAAGRGADNQRLSEARAGAVARFLTAQGLAANRVSAVGYGELRPIAPNDTPANRARNRRIEFVIRK